MKNKLWIGLFCCAALAGCKPESDAKTLLSQQRLGQLAGMPIRLSEEVLDVQYENQVLRKDEMRQYAERAAGVDFFSLIRSFTLKMQYHPSMASSDTLQSPQQVSLNSSQEQREGNAQWLSIVVNAGADYQPNLTATTAQFIADANPQGAVLFENTGYALMQIPTHQQRFGLVKYAPHPQWIKKQGYEKTHDMFLYYNGQGEVLTYIQCDNRHLHTLISQCKMYWNLEPVIQAQLTVSFLRSQLHDWKLIRSNAEKKVLALMVVPNS